MFHILPLAKLHLQLGLKPVAIGLVCPIVLKFLMGFRVFRDDALHHSRLFLFQLGQIAFNREAQVSHIVRMERALRLIWRTVAPNNQDYPQIGQDTLLNLSMLAL
ncbi:hypothetical protein RJT34_33549 [Clitoria ternatea]|uniref:Uncharacterized protein n=1 Tax=Clitoria ternatea TaxID=43366 RepID=A0AAN9EZK5_CLITE